MYCIVSVISPMVVPKHPPRSAKMMNRPDRLYEYTKWTYPAEEDRFKHRTMLPPDCIDVVIKEQGDQYPSYCVLCAQGFLCMNYKNAAVHYGRVHQKHRLEIQGYSVLACKCEEVRYRGSDESRRNMHWHCPECHKAVEDRKALGHHLSQRHNWPLKRIRGLCAEEYKHS